MYITKKNIVLTLIAAALVVCAFAIYGFDKYKSADERAYYWYQKYTAEKHDRAREMKNLSSIVYTAVKNDTVIDDGVGAIWFEDTEYCEENNYCAVWVGGTSVRVIK